MLNYGNFLQNYESEFAPFRFELIILIDNDLEFPGFPIISMGILFIIHIRVVNKFYLNEKFNAILSCGILSLLT